ncbi:MAG: transglycosylase SLT domain-containing protein [Vicinamibacterales bacterium]
MWGASPQLTATLAYVHNQLGNLRAGINAMKRAYPQWMAAGESSCRSRSRRSCSRWNTGRSCEMRGGQRTRPVSRGGARCPRSPPSIRRFARRPTPSASCRCCRPPAAGVARRLKLRFTPARLTDPETNVRLGTSIFAASVKRFGGVHYALAAYNAGDHRVATWLRERPGLPQDEFIDRHPVPETQNYVKRILGTAADYRRLCGK